MNRVISAIPIDRVVKAISSRWFLITVISIFSLGALWLAFSLNTRGSYDEAYHLAIISVYKDHLLPFITTQQPSYDTAGDLTRLPSYLFHYLMSWPARGISLFTHDFHTQVFLLRVINITFFVSALLVYRKVLHSLGLGRALVNATVLFMTLIPLSVQLAATVNYDNLLFLVSGMTLLVFIKINKASKLTYADAALFLSMGMLGALVKYTFLPLYVPLFIYVVVKVVRRDGRNTWKHLVKSGSVISKKKRGIFIGLSLLLIVSSGLFLERYGVNIVKYHAITPKCEKLMSSERCAKYYVWQRNTVLYNTRNENPIDTDIFVYFGQWLRGMTTTPFYPQLIVDDKGNPLGPLPLLVQAFQTLVVAGAVLLLTGYRFIAENKTRLFITLTSAFYVAVLFMDNYSSYLTYHVPVATSGRYLLIVLPLLIGIAAYAANRYFQRYRYAPIGLLVVITVLMLQGGGVATDILRGQRSWFWEETTYNLNTKVKNVLEPVIKERGF